jgi:hypothetical protein
VGSGEKESAALPDPWCQYGSQVRFGVLVEVQDHVDRDSDAMQLTKRNHYNPCFWTAHWNTAYLESALAGRRDCERAREQPVFALNVKSNAIYETAVENVHYDKNLGVAKITPKAARDFCKRNFPDEYQQFCEDIKDHEEHLYLDFESILTSLEATPAYTTLLHVIAEQRIRSPVEKAFLAGFVHLHQLRSHAIMNSMLEWSQTLGMERFEYFWRLKHDLGNKNRIYSRVMLFAPFRWKYYRIDRDTFPLNDSPILVHPENIMVALSPRLLLEIDRTQRQAETSWESANFVRDEKLNEFRSRTIANTFREIIFGNRTVLEEWQRSEEFQARHRLMANVDSYNTIVEREGTAELWKINAYGGA